MVVMVGAHLEQLVEWVEVWIEEGGQLNITAKENNF